MMTAASIRDGSRCRRSTACGDAAAKASRREGPAVDRWAVVDLGCLHCDGGSEIVSLHASREQAERAADRAFAERTRPLPERYVVSEDAREYMRDGFARIGVLPLPAAGIHGVQATV